MKRTMGESLFNVVNKIFLTGLVIITLYPFLYIVFASLSDPDQLVRAGGFLLKPEGFSLNGYKAVFENKDIFIGYGNTLLYVLAGTTLSVITTALLAYPLSRRELMLGKGMMLLILFTMFFNGGMIPGYLVVKGIGLLNSRWAVILTSLLSTYNLIVMRTAFSSIPDSLVESAKIDGANDFVILFRIVLPLTGATLAVMVLFYGVAQWNSWFNAMLYLTDRSKFPLQLILREILIDSSMQDMSMGADVVGKANLEEVIKYATIVVATVPILCVYPFIQKYFVNGVMIGAVKG